MRITLPRPNAARHGLNRLLAPAVGLGLLLAAAPGAHAQTLYGIGEVSMPVPPATTIFFPTGANVGDQGIYPIDRTSGLPITLPVPITGVAAGYRVVGSDFRPNTGELFALAYNATAASPTANSQLYILNPTTGATTAVGTAVRLELGGPGERIGFDFNPTVDRIRVEGTNGRNYRLNPNNSAIAATDGNLAYLSGTPATAGIGAVAYLNSYRASSNTTLYAIDELNSLLATQSPPNDGVLINQLPLTTNGFGFSTALALDVDASFFTTPGTNEVFMIEVTAPNNLGLSSSNLYTLNLATGAAMNKVNVVPAAATSPFNVFDIAVSIPAPAPLAALTGQLTYAVTSSSQLVSFDSDTPGVIRSVAGISGLAMGQTLAGIDFRPATGQLFALGYNPANGESRLYTVNLGTGALTAVGAAPITLALGGASEFISFDFNPTVDRIRVLSSNRVNYRLNPNDGSLTATDTPLTPTTPVISSAAYTNNQSGAMPFVTMLYDFDATTGTLYQQAPANSGTLVMPVSTGLTAAANAGSDFDIYNTPSTTTNLALLAVNTDATPGRTTFDNLYSLNLATGAPTNLGSIGLGLSVTGLAAFVAGNTLVWNGSVSTAWGLPANWSPAQVPNVTDNVLIPGGTPNQPTVSNAQQANNITLNGGAVLTLASGGTLTSGGNFVNNGGSVAGGGTGTLVLSGITPVPTIGGSSLSTFPNLTISTTAATTSGPVGIMQTLNLNGTLTIGTGQTFTLLSSAAGTAYVVNNAGGTLTGTATVQRYIDPSLNSGPGYRHYSSPVSGNTVADLTTTGFAPVLNTAYNTSATPGTVTPFPNVFGYDQTRVGTVTSNYPAFDQGYFSPAATTTALETARGYTVNITASALVDFVGTANNGPISVTGLGRNANAQGGWHLRGNPYPSPLDWQAMIANSRLTGMENALYVFKSSGQYTGSYASYVAGVGTNGGSNVLPLAQGFFVRAAAGQMGSISFTNAERLINDPGTTFQRGTADTRPLLTLALSGAAAATQAAVYFDATATTAFDATNDAVALPAPNGLVLATETGAELLAINGQPALNGQDVLLPLHIAATTAGTYALHVDALSNLPANYFAYLRDAVTGRFTDLAATPTVTLNLAANAPAAGRYAVLFTTQARVLATAPAALAALVSVYPNPAHGTATLLLPQALRGAQATTVQVLDNLGRTVLTRTLAAGATATLELPLGTLAPGVYSVQARTAAGTVAKRLVVQ